MVAWEPDAGEPREEVNGVRWLAWSPSSAYHVPRRRTTPNLASWVNRVAMLLGYQPYNVEVSTEVLAGIPVRGCSFTKLSEHIRPFTLKALKELLYYHEFKIVKISGTPGVYPKF